jgi:hypothetical protein
MNPVKPKRRSGQVKTVVPRRTEIVLSGGQKACVRCFKRPVMMRRARTKTGAGSRRVPGSYCRICATEISRQWREGTIQVQLTAEEWAAVKAARQEPAGRHHAPA